MIYSFGNKTISKYIKVESSDTHRSLAKDLLDYIEMKEKLIDDINI